MSLKSLEINTDAQADDIGFSSLHYPTSGDSKYDPSFIPDHTSSQGTPEMESTRGDKP